MCECVCVRVRVCVCARVQQATKQTHKVGAWARGTLRPSPPAPRDVVRVVEVELKKKNVCRGMLNAFIFFVLHLCSLHFFVFSNH